MTTDSAPNLPTLAEVRAPLDLDRVYREHAAQVSRWVRRLSSYGAADTSDVLQEVFEVAQRRSTTFRGDAQITTWLFSITVRVVSARRRRAHFRRLFFAKAASQVDTMNEPVTTPDDALNRKHATRVVYSVLDRLSERDRNLLILFELERLSALEIATMWELTSNNVAVGLHRARARFRKLLARHFPEEFAGMDHGQITP